MYLCNPLLLPVTKPVKPKVPGIKPREIHRPAITSFHFLIIRLRSACTSNGWAQQNGSAALKSQCKKQELEPLCQCHTTQTSPLRALQHPIMSRTSALRSAALPESLHFFSQLCAAWSHTHLCETGVQHTLQAKPKDLRACRCNTQPFPICSQLIHLGQTTPNPSNSRAQGTNTSPESTREWVQPPPFTLPFKNKKGKAFLFIWQCCPAKTVFTAEHFPRCQFCNSGPGCDPLSMMDGFKIKAL